MSGIGEERTVQYDVFVSYAHDPSENKAWVKNMIVGPLRALRHADGTPYRIFFDEAEIKVGRRWEATIELALLGTRCVVPVSAVTWCKLEALRRNRRSNLSGGANTAPASLPRRAQVIRDE